MKEVIIDTILDTIKLIPFLILTFYFMELLEHKFSKKSKEIIKKSTKAGPIYGSILGVIPQCGFSVAATNLYVTNIITFGTLIAIYLSTSDEMLPIMISEKVSLFLIFKVLIIKVVIGIICGVIIDLIFNKKTHKHDHVHELCQDCNCGCEENIFKSVLKHTINIVVFILLINLIFNTLFYFIGEEKIARFILKDSLFAPFFTSLVGLIPNCASSVIITELYLKSAISFGALIAGLLTNSGVALVVLFKENKNIKENLKIIFTMYFIGALVGIILNILKI